MNAPTPSDLDHLEHIQSEFAELVDMKYRLGIREHGGHLWEKPLDTEALMEAVDQVAYLITLRDQITQACEIAHDGYEGAEDARYACYLIMLTLGRKVDKIEATTK